MCGFSRKKAAKNPMNLQLGILCNHVTKSKGLGDVEYSLVDLWKTEVVKEGY